MAPPPAAGAGPAEGRQGRKRTPPPSWTAPPLTLDGISAPPTSAGPARRTPCADGHRGRDPGPLGQRHRPPPGDFLFPYRPTAAYLRGGDLLFINLEAPLLERCPRTDEG